MGLFNNKKDEDDEMIDVYTLDIDGKEYELIFKIEVNGKEYTIFAAEDNPADIQIFRSEIEDGEAYYVSLDSEMEFNEVLSEIGKKIKIVK